MTVAEWCVFAVVALYLLTIPLLYFFWTLATRH